MRIVPSVFRWLAVVIVVTRPVYAQPDDPKVRAQALYDEGSTHYKLREYDAAIAAFKRAYEAFPEPTFLFDLAQAYRQQHDCENALSFYRTFLHDKPDAEDRPQVEKLITEMETCVSEQKRQRDEAARQRIVTAPPPVAPPPPLERHEGLRIAGLAIAGAGVIAAGAGGYFSYDAANQASLLEQKCMPKCAASDVASIDSKGKSSESTAITLYAVGGSLAAIGTGVLVWAVLHSDPETVQVSPVPGGATVSTGVRF